MPCSVVEIPARIKLPSGADANHTAKHGLTALMLAVVNGHVEVVRALLDGGADTKPHGTGTSGFANRTALDLAVARGDAAIVALLQRPDPNVESPHRRQARTYLPGGCLAMVLQ